MKSRKLGSIGNGIKGHNTSYIGKDMEMNMINRLQKQDYLMQKR